MKLYKKIEIRCNKELLDCEGWKCKQMPGTATESFFPKSICLDWAGEGCSRGKPANLFMSHLT